MLEKIATIMNMSAEEIKNHPHLMVSVVDRDLKMLYFNKSCERYFGIKEEDVLNKKVADLLPDLWNAGKFNFFNRTIAGETVYIVNGKYERKEGMYDQVTIPLKNSEGVAYAALNIVIDLLYQREEAQQTFALAGQIYLNH